MFTLLFNILEERFNYFVHRKWIIIVRQIWHRSQTYAWYRGNLGTDQYGGLCFFVSFRIFFSDNTSVRILIFFCRAKRNFFFKKLTLGYMTKTLNQIIFFFLHQNQNIFFSNIGNQNILLEKNHNPFKLNGRSLKFLLNLSKIKTKLRYFCVCVFYCLYIMIRAKTQSGT